MLRHQPGHTASAWARPRGTIIFTALIFLGIIAIMTVAMLRYALYQQRMTERRIEREAVHHAAEAGIDQVVHWLNNPDEWQALGGSAGLFEPHDDEGSFFDDSGASVFASRTLPTLISESTNEDLITFEHEAGSDTERARITSLTLSVPASGGGLAGAFLTVTSRAENERGVARIIRATLSQGTNAFSFSAPAAIISHIDAGTGGQANVHWGEGWFRGDFQLPNGGLNSMTTTLEDPWAIFRATGHVLMSSGKYADGSNNGSRTPLPPGAPNYEQPWGPDGDPLDPDHTNIYQHADPDSLEWPILDYETFRDLALTRGHFFSTDADGNLYYGTEETDANQINGNEFLDIVDQSDDLTVNTAVEGDQTLPPATIIFIDTVDGNPPAADGSNLADIQLAGGGGIFTRGVWYIGGDLRVGGAGSPPEIWMADPDEVFNPGTGSWELESVRHAGIIYTDGSYGQQGNQITYGTVIAKGGFQSGGTPNVWYDASLSLGLPFSSATGVGVALWEEITPEMEAAGI